MKSIKSKTILIQKLKKEKYWVNIAAFNYFDKSLIVLSATTGGIFIISFVSVVGASEGITSASFSLVFSLTTATGIIKKLLEITRNKVKKHNKILLLAKSKLNSIKNLI